MAPLEDSIEPGNWEVICYGWVAMRHHQGKWPLALTGKTHSGDKALSPRCPSVNCPCFLQSGCFHPSRQKQDSCMVPPTPHLHPTPAFSTPCSGRHSEAQCPSSLEQSGSHSLGGCEHGEVPGDPGALNETISSRTHFWSPLQIRFVGLCSPHTVRSCSGEQLWPSKPLGRLSLV